MSAHVLAQKVLDYLGEPDPLMDCDMELCTLARAVLRPQVDAKKFAQHVLEYVGDAASDRELGDEDAIHDTRAIRRLARAVLRRAMLRERRRCGDERRNPAQTTQRGRLDRSGLEQTRENRQELREP